ncbi:MAG: cysteine hydrolase [Aigarchaeota archaeon]|nr:cysteine hydrolase [Candidatus Pelearchaeum maunauluense]
MEQVELPEPQAAEVDSRKTALIIVDMQNDFAHPNGRLFVPTAPATIPAIKELLDNARKAGVMIIYTQDWHGPNDPEFKIWGEHALANTWGAEIVDELKPEPSDTVVKKLRYDAFYGTPLDHILRLADVENLVIVGTVANICVLHTAGSAALRWFNIYLPIDGISALTDFDMKAAIRQVSFLYRGTITRSDLIKFV